MSGDFKPVPLAKLPIDAHKHVRYVDGMVLGVDDFEQEFAYLSERDKLFVRMLAGYGAVRGLRVFARGAGTADAEIVVSAGLGITPSGDVVRVPSDQCANLRKWIEGARVETPGDGDERRLVAYITAEYATRTSDPVPIPGEPCRTEGEIQADSRVADGFRLELSVEPPAQPEEDAATAYLTWLQKLTPLDGAGLPETGGTPLPEILKAIVRAAWEKADGQPGSPPAPSGGEEPLVFGSHPRGPGGAALAVDRKEALAAYLSGLEKLADVRALSAVLEGTATGSIPCSGGKDQTKLLLGQVTIPVERASLGSDVFLPQIGPAVQIDVDTSLAPRLLSLRFLARAAFAAVQRLAASAVTINTYSNAPPAKRYVVAAAGQVIVAPSEAAATPSPASVGGLRAWADGPNAVVVDFVGLGVRSDRYVVKVLPGQLGPVTPQVNLERFGAADTSRFRLSVTAAGGPFAAAGLPLSIEIGAVVD